MTIMVFCNYIFVVRLHYVVMNVQLMSATINNIYFSHTHTVVTAFIYFGSSIYGSCSSTCNTSKYLFMLKACGCSYELHIPEISHPQYVLLSCQRHYLSPGFRDAETEAVGQPSWGCAYIKCTAFDSGLQYCSIILCFYACELAI